MKFLFLTCFFLSVNALAIDVKVVFVKGDVEKTDLSGESSAVKKGSILQEGDTIKTYADSMAILKIKEHSTHRLEAGAQLQIEDLPYKYEDSEELEQGGSFFLKVGTIFSNIFLKSGNTSLELKTKNTTMGVRGTTFMASADETKKDVWLSVNEGEVEIKNAKSTNHDVVLPGQTITVEKDNKFTQPKYYSWVKSLNWDASKDKVKGKENFRNLKFIAYNKFKEKKSKWVRNEEVWKKRRENWKKRKEKWREKVKNLKPNELRQKRADALRRKLKKFKNKRFNNKLLRNLKTGKQEKPKLDRNEFIKKRKRMQDVEESMKVKQERIKGLREKFKRKRRRFRPKQ
jgi:hypothetical protein